jgi:tRNA pseudouridine38-40 synthase
VVSFSLTSGIACDALVRALNVRLDRDVRVMHAEEARDDFNARFDARRKTYHYAIYNAPVVPPPLRNFAWHVPQPLDAGAMDEAARTLIGEHDFAAFQAAGSDVVTTRREVLASQVVGRDGQVVYEVTGTGFLRHMVRTIVGTLVDIGLGRRAVEDMTYVLLARDRAQASATAPPQGLTLVRVDYE